MGWDDISVQEKMCVFINSLYKWYNMNLCMYKCCVYTNLDIQIDLYTYISTDTYGQACMYMSFYLTSIS